MLAKIISIGNELLNGSITNSNATYISSVLYEIGYEVIKISAVQDDFEMILREFETDKVDLYVTTGGLGPTDDDLTKEVVSKITASPLVEYKKAIEHLEKYFTKPLPQYQINQALFPQNSKLLDNVNGTALGCVSDYEDSKIILLPGPPHEMKPMLELGLKYIKKSKIDSKKYKIVTLGESTIEQMISSIKDKYPDVYFAPYASLSHVDYIIKSNVDIKEACDDFERTLSNCLISSEFKTYNEYIVKSLSDLNLTISFAESCTGGLLASSIIEVSGSSSIIDQSFITYSNESKKTILGVSDEVLSIFGAVSEECAIQMASGLKKIVGSDICISVTGIAGPTGGTKIKPVGLVYVCVNYKDNKCYKFNLNGDRTKIRSKVVYKVFDILHNIIRGEVNEN